jgi:hypothetical protein
MSSLHTQINTLKRNVAGNKYENQYQIKIFTTGDGTTGLKNITPEQLDKIQAIIK